MVFDFYFFGDFGYFYNPELPGSAGAVFVLVF
jgi:hypothetical protein